MKCLFLILTLVVFAASPVKAYQYCDQWGCHEDRMNAMNCHQIFVLSGGYQTVCD